ncbi:hypothetical protein BH11PAT4_BH11PAT4_1040 [soil metagenome]
MKIAFVGKGGSGKTTLSAFFIQYLRSIQKPVLAVDADINMHLASLLGYEELTESKLHISNPDNVRDIKTILRGSNPAIAELVHFRKSTPPGNGSHLIYLDKAEEPIVTTYSIGEPQARLMVVGSYGTEGIGVSCYHNNLAVLENVLSHTVDGSRTVVADMVAGTDAFASTLHAQFDLLVLSVEPTRRGVEVLNQFRSLAEEAGILERLRVMGNKARSPEDEFFIRENIPAEFLIGILFESDHLREIERTGEALDVQKMDTERVFLMEKILKDLESHALDPDIKLAKLQELHRKYVAQDFIAERFGDLTSQIDPSFSFKEAHAN